MTQKRLIGVFFVVLVTTTCFIFVNLFTSEQTRLSFGFTSRQNGQECKMSLMESDGWFCESDEDWIRRKNLHYIQHIRNRAFDNRSSFFDINWEPTIQCESEERLGQGDGGKWICDVNRYRKTNEKNLIIYSLGSRDDFSFERAIKENIPQSEIHTFDINSYECPADLCTFHQTRFGDGKTSDSKTIQMIMKELGHEQQTLQILKVDIEGSEFDLFETLFQSSTSNRSAIPYIRQILFEIHLGPEKDPGAITRAHNLFELFHKNHYAIFHKEPNSNDPKYVHEYALLRLNPSFFLSTIV